ncbi:hypothetical protein B0J17DRAFT_676816 [Rhizoctonia solani]|nr:hypothetical protein B0J17DRAFT_676816 [Rhizoctonia solani]
MKLFGHHPRHFKERESYISSSLTSSAELVERLTSSSTNDPSRALVMRFNKQWLDPYCPVYRWYQQQRQARSSTDFTSIEHWKTKRAPFYHEYLIIRLNGEEDVCRVERLGEGSRRDAIKRLGCTAYDIIQCVSTVEYASSPISKEPAELVCRVEFPRAFDLQDILAICWSVQQTPRCSAYTPQRYNCYFLCSTILAVLLVASGDEYIGLSICDLIEPNHPDPRSFILDKLRDCLSLEGLIAWGTSTSATLWMKNLELASTEGLASHVRNTCVQVLEDKIGWASTVKGIFDFDRRDADSLRAHNISPEFKTAIERGFGLSLCQSILENAASTRKMYRMFQVEYQPAIWWRMMASGLAGLTYVFGALGAGCELSLSGEGLGGWSEALNNNWSRSFRRNPLAAISYCRLEFLDYGDINIIRARTWGLRSLLYGVPISLPLQRTLQSPTCPSRITKLHALMILFDWDVWVESLQACVGRSIYNAAKAHIARIESRSISHTDLRSNTRELSAGQFHDYIWEHIRVHAKRVESARLAAAQLVETGIEMAMSDVWTGLPTGYGGMYTEPNRKKSSYRKAVW